MQYRLDKYGNRISALGFGCMRFQRKGEKYCPRKFPSGKS